MRLVTTASQLHAALGNVPARSVLVPTMGALHDGHAALIRQGATLARERCWPSGCVVSIFVNPTQFNETTDFDRYPRTLDADLRLCEAAGAAIVFAPALAEVFPPGHEPSVPPLPAVATQPQLEDKFRPGHFAGVCQVVRRLFDLCTPGAAIFGEKDWQQLQVIRALTASLTLPIDIVPAPTVREQGGLAMSSRNRFLSPEDRTRALAIHGALREASQEPSPARAEARMHDVLAEAEIRPEYAVVRDAETLLAAGAGTTRHRALIAARIGEVRLIDNLGWPEERRVALSS